jgi:tetratricopeptide (TPR) repeat protein
LRKLREAAANGTLRLDEHEIFPQGLIGLYDRWLRRWFPQPTDDLYKSKYRPLMEVLVAASHPVPEHWISRIFEWSPAQTQSMLEGLGSLFERRLEGLSPFHKSFRDWLTNPRAAGAFVVDEQAGTRRLRNALWLEFEQHIRSKRPLDGFCTIELPAQMLRTPAEEVKPYVSSAGAWQAVRQSLAAITTKLRERFAWAEALAWCKLMAYVAAAANRESDQSSALEQAGDILMLLGNTGDALKYQQEGLALRRRLAELQPTSCELHTLLANSLNKIGRLLLAQGDLKGALQCLREDVVISKNLLSESPDSKMHQHNLSVSLLSVGDVLRERGRLQDALQMFQQSLWFIEPLAMLRPEKGFSRHSAIVYERIGDIYFMENKLDAALEQYQMSLQRMTKLKDMNPTDLSLERSATITANHIGDVLFNQGRFDEALKYYNESLHVREKLTRADPENVEWQRDLAASHAKLGNLQLNRDQLAEALASFRNSLTISETLATGDFRNASVQHDVLTVYQKLGDVLRRHGQNDQALEAYKRSIEIGEKASASYPRAREALMGSYEKVGDLQGAMGRHELAAGAYERALKLAEMSSSLSVDESGVSSHGNAGLQGSGDDAKNR